MMPGRFPTLLRTLTVSLPKRERARIGQVESLVVASCLLTDKGESVHYDRYIYEHWRLGVVGKEFLAI